MINKLSISFSKLEIPILILIILISIFLRFYKISEFPPGLYIDEVSIGLEAKSILVSGRDTHGVKFPLFFEALEDFKSPAYIYLTSIPILIFGPNDFSVRLISLISSIGSIVLIFYILKKIIDLDKLKDKFSLRYLPLIAAFLLSTSSWHLHFSRGGFEVSLALFIYLLSLFIALISINKNKYIFLSIIFLSFTLYVYPSYRIISSLTLLLFLNLWFSKKDIKKIILSVILFLLISFPILYSSFSGPGNVRFKQTSIFNEKKELSGLAREIEYPLKFIDNYATYYSTLFLFKNGDGIGRHQIPGFGALFKWYIPFLIIGFYLLFSLKKSLLKKITIFLFLISPIAASIAIPSPHTLRSLNLVIPFMIITSLGICRLIDIKSKIKYLVAVLIIVFAIYEQAYYFHYYYSHYSKVNILDWGSGYKDIINEASKVKNVKYIVIDSNLVYAQLYFNFYNPNLNILMVNQDWAKPKQWGEEKVLYIRPFYGNKGENHIKDINLKNPNNDIFAQFYLL